MMDLLKQFPALWVILGFVLAAGAFWIANRKVFQWQGEATTNLRETLKEQISAITKERDDYRQKLHSERDNHQATKLRVQELELRPDITALFRASEQFYAKQAEAMSRIVESIQEHDRTVGERMQPILKSLETIGNGITELLRRTPAKR